MAFGTIDDMSDSDDDTDPLEAVVLPNNFKRMTIFANPNLIATNESLLCSTSANVAQLHTQHIYNAYYEARGEPPISITDATANVGGNTISFASMFERIVAFEIKRKTYNHLVCNVEMLGLSRAIETKCANFCMHVDRVNTQCVYIDPPWYINKRYNRNMTLHPCDMRKGFTLAQVVCLILHNQPYTLIAAKVPPGYVGELCEAKRITMKKMDLLIYFKWG